MSVNVKVEKDDGWFVVNVETPEFRSTVIGATLSEAFTVMADNIRDYENGRFTDHSTELNFREKK